MARHACRGLQALQLGVPRLLPDDQTLSRGHRKEVPRAQRRTLKRALSEFEIEHPRNEAIARAYLSGRHTMAEIAKHFGIHYTTVSRLVRAYEGN